MPSIQTMASRIVSAAWFSSATWLIAAGTCTHCKDHQRPSGSASTVYTSFSNRHSPSPVFWSYTSSLRRAQMRRGGLSAGRTVFGWLRVGSASWSCGCRCAPWVSAGVARRICCRPACWYVPLLGRCSSRGPGAWSVILLRARSRAAARCSSCRTRIWSPGECPTGCGTF